MATEKNDKKARAVGINHVAIEVGDIDAALEFYGSFIDFEISSRSDAAAFIYFGDQFINFSSGRNQGPDVSRHFGIAVDDKALVHASLERMGVKILDARFLDFSTPGEIGSKLQLTKTFNTPRPIMFWMVWALGI